jgi:hypothetical protein
MFVGMRIDTLEQFVTLRRQLTEERSALETRLRQINEALGEISPPSLSALAGATPFSGGARRGRRAAGGGPSLRELVLDILKGGPKTKEELLATVQQRGYKFSTGNPMNSLGVILYGKNPKLRRVEGRFALPAGFSAGGTVPSKAGQAGKRGISAEGRARIAQAQRARWAASRKGRGTSEKADSNGTAGAQRRQMSPAARKAIAEAARKRWAAAKASGRSRL